MTLTLALADSYTVTGVTYRAVFHYGLIYLSVSPDSDVADALSCVLPLARLREWSVEWSNEEPDGWDTYLISRDFEEPCVTSW